MIFLINFLCYNIGVEISSKRIKLQLYFAKLVANLIIY